MLRFGLLTRSDQFDVACEIGACCLAIAVIVFGVTYVSVALFLKDTGDAW